MRKIGGAVEDKALSRDIIHRINNFLTIIGTQGETAMMDGDADSREKALLAILKESDEVRDFLRQKRRELEDS